MFFYIKNAGAVFLGACLQVWRSRLTEESTRLRHTKEHKTRAPHTQDLWADRGGAASGRPPLYGVIGSVCGARVLCSFVWRACAFLCEPRAPDLQASPQENRFAGLSRRPPAAFFLRFGRLFLKNSCFVYWKNSKKHHFRILKRQHLYQK